MSEEKKESAYTLDERTGRYVLNATEAAPVKAKAKAKAKTK